MMSRKPVGTQVLMQMSSGMLDTHNSDCIWDIFDEKRKSRGRTHNECHKKRSVIKIKE